jgi:hypothetical protein
MHNGASFILKERTMETFTELCESFYSDKKTEFSELNFGDRKLLVASWVHHEVRDHDSYECLTEHMEPVLFSSLLVGLLNGCISKEEYADEVLKVALEYYSEIIQDHFEDRMSHFCYMQRPPFRPYQTDMEMNACEDMRERLMSIKNELDVPSFTNLYI